MIIFKRLIAKYLSILKWRRFYKKGFFDLTESPLWLSEKFMHMRNACPLCDFYFNLSTHCFGCPFDQIDENCCDYEHYMKDLGNKLPKHHKPIKD
jgi:hypothetical protein